MTASAFTSITGWPEKHRPKTFADVIGQPMAVAELQGMLKTKELPNGLMFYGQSGTGKTTLAQLVARYINCKTFDACGTCDSCKAMNADRHPDLHFMNASAESGKDDVKGLIKNAMYAPRFNVRVFIIDEAQGLSKAAMEALLVPVEKPPGQTLYCFASTDPQKLPATLLGRISNIEVKPASTAALVTRLKQIAAAEKVKFPESVYVQCAQSESTRVAVGLLQKAYYILKNNPKTPMEQVLKALGSFEDSETSAIASRLLLAMYRKDGKALIQAVYDAKDAVGVVNQALFMNQFVLGVLAGAKSQVIWAPVNKEFLAAAKKVGVTIPGLLIADRRLTTARHNLVTQTSGSLHILLSSLTAPTTKE